MNSKTKKKELFTSFLKEIVSSIGVKDLNSQYCLQKILKSCSLSPEFLNKQLDVLEKEIDWDDISDLNLSIAFIKRFEDNLNWSHLCKYKKFSESFLIEHQSHLDWKAVSKYQILSEEFIVKFKKELDWTLLFVHQKMSTRFVEKHQENIDGKRVFHYQILLKAIDCHVEDENEQDLEDLEEDSSDAKSIETDDFIVSE